jgi:hypothetical protein
MSEVKEIREILEVFYDDLKLLRASIDRIEAEVVKEPKEEGTWKDLVVWLRDIPGAPRLSQKNSVSQYCGRGKIFQPGRHYFKRNRERVFIRSKVIEAVQKNRAFTLK